MHKITVYTWQTFLICFVFSCTNGLADEVMTSLLDKQHAEKTLGQCSRKSYEIDDSWNPSKTNIQALEQNLDKIKGKVNSKVKWLDSPSTLDDYYRQYVGVVWENKNFIYINAIHKNYIEEQKIEMFVNWRNEPIVICDGGAYFWGGIFDPTNNTFHDIDFNGPL